jgi:hypothetical protein
LGVSWYRQVRQRPAQPINLDPAAAQAVIESAMATPVLGGQGQPDQRGDRPITTQHRVGQLEQRIRAQRQAVIEHTTKPGKITQTSRACLLGPTAHLQDTDTHGTALCLRDLWNEPEDDQTVAVSCHDDTPPRTTNPRSRG